MEYTENTKVANVVTEQEALQVLNEVKSVIAKTLNCDETEITLDARWKNNLCADSLELLFVMMEIDKQLGIRVNDQDGWTLDSSLRESCSSIVRTLRQLGRM